MVFSAVNAAEGATRAAPTVLEGDEGLRTLLFVVGLVELAWEPVWFLADSISNEGRWKLWM